MRLNYGLEFGAEKANQRSETDTFIPLYEYKYIAQGHLKLRIQNKIEQNNCQD